MRRKLESDSLPSLGRADCIALLVEAYEQVELKIAGSSTTKGVRAFAVEGVRSRSTSCRHPWASVDHNYHTRFSPSDPTSGVYCLMTRFGI
jgi:hypothetical protein